MSDLMTMVGEWMPELLVAALGTLKMTVVAFVIALVLGLVLALMRVSHSRIASTVAAWYIEIVRGVPALTLLFLIYFGLPGIGITLDAFPAAVIGLGLSGGAYLAEVYRAGIQAIHRGQTEAAQSIGMTRPMAMRHIIMPQALRVILPPIANYGVALLKDTSIASLISAPELMLRARDLTSEYFTPMELFIVVGIMYFVMACPMSIGVRYLEIYLQKRR